MLANISFFTHGILFIIFIFSTLSGVCIVKTKYFRSIINRETIIKGPIAIIAGLTLILFGLLCLLIMFYIPNYEPILNN